MVDKKKITTKKFINVFELRYRILKEFYDNLMVEDDPIQLKDLRTAFKNFVVNDRLILANTQYLMIYHYINKVQSDPEKQPTFNITPKGIKLIENITEGEIEYKLTPRKVEDAMALFNAFNLDDTDPKLLVSSASPASSKGLKQ